MSIENPFSATSVPSSLTTLFSPFISSFKSSLMSPLSLIQTDSVFMLPSDSYRAWFPVQCFILFLGKKDRCADRLTGFDRNMSLNVFCTSSRLSFQTNSFLLLTSEHLQCSSWCSVPWATTTLNLKGGSVISPRFTSCLWDLIQQIKACLSNLEVM